MLQQRFAIVRYPALTWSDSHMHDVMNACVIMHNMIIENELDNPVVDDQPFEGQEPLAQLDGQVLAQFAQFLATHIEILDSVVHETLQADLIEHLWMLKGNAA